MRQDLGRTFVGAHHGDPPAEGRIVKLLAPLKQPDQFLEQSCHSFSVTASKDHLVATNGD